MSSVGQCADATVCVFARRFSAAGAPASGEIRMSDGANFYERPRIAAVEGGAALVVWSAFFQPGAGVYGWFLGASGPAVDAARRLDPEDGRGESQALAVNAAGDAAGAWTDQTTDVKAQRYRVLVGVAGEAQPGEAQADGALALSVFPTPARGAEVRVRAALPDPQHVRLSVTDALGRTVAVLADEAWPAGERTLPVAVDGLAPGVYVVRLEAGARSATRLLTVVR